MHDIHVNKKYSLRDESFQPGFRDKHFLSIEISFDTFSYCILDNDRFKYRLAESFECSERLEADDYMRSIESIVRDNPYLTSGFERVTLIYVSPQSVFIPSELYKEEEKASYLSFNHIIKNGYKPCSEKLYNLDAYVVYPLPDFIKHTFDKLFPDYRLRHFSTALIESVLYDVRYAGYKADMVIHVQKNHFEILLLDGTNLLFFNSFNYKTWDDILYYLFFVMEQAEISAENIDLLMVGRTSMDTDLYKNLKPYFRSVDFGKRSDLFKYDDTFDEIPHHYFYNLLNVNACG